MIDIKQNSIFHLATRNTSYVFALTPSGITEHIYYGRRLRDPAFSLSAMREKHLASPLLSTVSDRNEQIALDDTLLEISTEGRGDYRTPSIAISYGEKGERTLRLSLKSYRVTRGIVRFRTQAMPQALASEDDAETLEVVYRDDYSGIRVTSYYTVFASADTITRRTVIANEGNGKVTVRALASATLDFRDTGFSIHSFCGKWADEREERITELKSGTYITESRHLASGPGANPGFILERGRECYALNLIYSSAHRESISVTENGITHVVWGMNSDMLSYPLSSGEFLESPEATMMYSPDGLDFLSDISHAFIERYIRRGLWKNRMKPLMLSSWEAEHFSINEKKAALMAKRAKELGFEGIIVDDGWFGARRNERTSLGDWYANTMKFPSGLAATAGEAHLLVLLFGSWMEPEAISEHSEIARLHPDWIIGRKPEENAIGRSEQLLDLTRVDVQNWLIGTLNKLIEITKIDYIRWDLSRLYSDPYSNGDIDDYGTFQHRYILGLYNVLDSVMKKNPQLYIEAAGSAHFDLGILSFASSAASSAATDPISRIRSLEGTLRLYPLSVTGGIISGSPNQMSGRIIDEETRFNLSAFGVLSYSIETDRMERDGEEKLKSQIEFYKAYRPLLQLGRFRVQESGNRVIWTVSNSDSSTILVLYFQLMRKLNTSAEKIRISNANEEYDYQFFARDHYQNEVEEALFPQEPECYNISGDSLKWAGISLVEQVSGSGAKDGMRNLPDFSSRLYILKKVVDRN